MQQRKSCFDDEMAGAEASTLNETSSETVFETEPESAATISKGVEESSIDACPLKLVTSSTGSPPVSSTTSAERLAKVLATARQKDDEPIKPSGAIRPAAELALALLVVIIGAFFCSVLIAYHQNTLAYPLFSLLLLAPAMVAASWPIRLGRYINGRAGVKLVETGYPAIYAAMHPVPLYLFSLTNILLLRDYTYWETGQKLVGIGGIISLMMLLVHGVIHLEWQFRFAERFRKIFNTVAITANSSAEADESIDGQKCASPVTKYYPLMMTGAAILFSIPAILYSPLWFIALFATQAAVYHVLYKRFSLFKFDQTRLQPRQVQAPQDLLLPYQHHAELSRWWKQRFAVRSTWKVVLIGLLACGLLTMNLPALVIFALAMFVKDSLPNAPLNAITAASQAGYSLTFMLVFTATLGLALGITLLNQMKKPNALALGPNGIRFRYPTLMAREDSYLKWSDIERIEMQRNPEKAHERRLLFIPATSSTLPSLTVKTDSLESAEARESLLSAIEFYAPHIKRSAEVTEALQSATDHSYTELWLQALGAPPKRERLKPLMMGTTLLDGRFQILKQLGSGGQGFAYLVEDAQREETLVLKEFILPIFVDLEERKRALKRFEDEARVLDTLDHPKIVKLFGFFVEDHRAYLVLEHIDGENLREHVGKHGTMKEEQAIEIAKQMAEILIYLHDLAPPLVHRDFTPDNLIINKEGQIKLIDFNVAQQTESSKTGTVVGKQAYLPPEQFRGLATTRSDLYALGATLSFLVTGRDPEAISVSSPMHEGAEVGEQFNSIIEKLTQPDELERLQSADQLLETLQEKRGPFDPLNS